MQWENTTNEEGAGAGARRNLAELAAACAENADHPRAKELFDRHKLPAFHDPFAGGGALPLKRSGSGLKAMPATSTRWRCSSTRR